MPPEPTTPAEKFASLLTGLGQAVAAMSGGDRLSYFLIGLIIERIRPIKQAFARLVARLVAGLAAGTFAPPPLYPAPQARPAPTTGRKSARTEIRLVEAAAAGHHGYRAQLENLLRDPEMAALIQTAPASLSRRVRSLCWMLGLRPPPLLKTPPRAKPTPQPPPRKTRKSPANAGLRGRGTKPRKPPAPEFRRSDGLVPDIPVPNPA